MWANIKKKGKDSRYPYGIFRKNGKLYIGNAYVFVEISGELAEYPFDSKKEKYVLDENSKYYQNIDRVVDDSNISYQDNDNDNYYPTDENYYNLFYLLDEIGNSFEYYSNWNGVEPVVHQEEIDRDNDTRRIPDGILPANIGEYLINAQTFDCVMNCFKGEKFKIGRNPDKYAAPIHIKKGDLHIVLAVCCRV